MINPHISLKKIFSFKKNQAIKADIGGIKKNKFEVLLAESTLIKYIKIVNAPNETAKICQPIDNINIKLKLIKGFSKKNITKNKNILAPTA